MEPQTVLVLETQQNTYSLHYIRVTADVGTKNGGEEAITSQKCDSQLYFSLFQSRLTVPKMFTYQLQY